MTRVSRMRNCSAGPTQPTRPWKWRLDLLYMVYQVAGDPLRYSSPLPALGRGRDRGRRHESRMRSRAGDRQLDSRRSRWLGRNRTETGCRCGELDQTGGHNQLPVLSGPAKGNAGIPSGCTA